jgi:S-adenosylmethionine decarboxylase
MWGVYELAKSHSARKRAEVVGLDQVRTAAEAAKAPSIPANTSTPTHTQDYFIERDGVRYAGTHLLVDLWGATNLDNQALIDEALRECIRVSGATLLHIHLHKFQENGGISGVAVLAESHISIHTWPERSYAAIDIFMCGSALPHKTIPVLRRYFQPQSLQLGEQKRGMSE